MTTTEAIILACFLVLLVWTGIAFKFKQKTVSQTMRDLAWKYNVTSFTFGILIGHWYFPVLHPTHHAVGNVLPFMATVFAGDLLWMKFQASRRAWWRYPGIWFVLGVPAGFLLWSQRLIM